MTSIPIAIMPIVARRRRRRGRNRRLLRIVTGLLVVMLIGIVVSVLAGLTIRSAMRDRFLCWIAVIRLSISISDSGKTRASFRARSARNRRFGCGRLRRSRINRLLRRYRETDAAAALIGDKGFAQQE